MSWFLLLPLCFLAAPVSTRDGLFPLYVQQRCRTANFEGPLLEGRRYPRTGLRRRNTFYLFTGKHSICGAAAVGPAAVSFSSISMTRKWEPRRSLCANIPNPPTSLTTSGLSKSIVQSYFFGPDVSEAKIRVRVSCMCDANAVTTTGAIQLCSVRVR
jgi:hypothetical protein